MNRIQFFPSDILAKKLNGEANINGVSVSQLVTDILENYYMINSNASITQLTVQVLNEVENHLKTITKNTPFDLNTASNTYRTINMTCGKKPSTVRASIGRSFASKIGNAQFSNVRKCMENGKQKLSANNALMYETF